MKFRLSVLAALWLPLQALAQQTPPAAPPPTYYAPYWHGPWHMWGDGGNFWWHGPLMLLVWLAVGLVIVLLLRRSGWDGHRHHGHGRSPGYDDPTSSALRILNERYARGEIDKAEYEEKRSVILSAGSR